MVAIPRHVQIFSSSLFHIADQFYEFHAKRILNWHRLNQTQVLTALLSNQSQFLVMFKFFVRHVFHIVIPFHRFHSKQIQN
jgi:hypothetical protein